LFISSPSVLSLSSSRCLHLFSSLPPLSVLSDLFQLYGIIETNQRGQREGAERRRVTDSVRRMGRDSVRRMGRDSMRRRGTGLVAY